MGSRHRRGKTHADDHVPVVEDSLVDHGLVGDVILVPAEERQAEGSDDERQENAPGAPIIHHASGSEPEEERRHARSEQSRADVIEPFQLLRDAAGDLVLVEEDDDEDETETDDWQVDVEDPSPGDILGEASPDQRTGDSSDRPHGGEQREPLTTECEGDEISHDDLGAGDFKSALVDLGKTHFIPRVPSRRDVPP